MDCLHDGTDGEWEIFQHLSMEFVREQNKYPYDSCDRDFPVKSYPRYINDKEDRTTILTFYFNFQHVKISRFRR